MSKKTVIFDLDGTLADISERRKISSMLNDNPKKKINWKVFFDPDNIKLDKPNESVIEMLQNLQKGGYTIRIFSGRDDITREVTLKWLEQYGVKIDSDMVWMRPHGSYTPDDELKLSWLNKLKEEEPDLELVCVFDDRDKVVKMWRENGVQCYQVNYGDF